MAQKCIPGILEIVGTGSTIKGPDGKQFRTLEAALSHTARCNKSGWDYENGELYVPNHDAEGNLDGTYYKYSSIEGVWTGVLLT